MKLQKRGGCNSVRKTEGVEGGVVIRMKERKNVTEGGRVRGRKEGRKEGREEGLGKRDEVMTSE